MVTGNIGLGEVYNAVPPAVNAAVQTRGVSLAGKKKTAARPAPAGRRKIAAITIHDVAALAGVSAISISRYFNQPDRLSEELRARVEDAVVRTGFVPSQVAMGLASARSKVVCAVIPSIANSVFSETVQGMTDVLRSSGHQLLLATSNYAMAEEESAVCAFAGWRPAAMILTGPTHTERTDAVLRAAGCPVVETWDVRPQRPFHQVGFSHEQAGHDQAMHLLEQGLRRIRFVRTGMPEDFRAEQRAQGYARAMEASGLAPDVHVPADLDPFEAGAKAITHFAAESARRRPQGIIFANDNMAAGAILAAPGLGLSLPLDCAIVGFGDFPIARRLTPALTTVHPGRYEIGRTAALLVLRLIGEGGGAALPPERHLVDTEFHVRASSMVRVSKGAGRRTGRRPSGA
ncbi:LacI family DNA-binding transcriptional regulator [Achromobacter aloeverae]|uniref:LacI family transcriptional regulator n=1 Tax=Achromobacter aloeverae TaxID=1750518 RepID=A0A4Q1HM77_9BURK|nr:LacI family DNA-binding transcriptional regulator [Achromobacter aloeverae]RXN91587.1 LacI family transcriptional regulator [Achromobacter aloeverae]